MFLQRFSPVGLAILAVLGILVISSSAPAQVYGALSTTMPTISGPPGTADVARLGSQPLYRYYSPGGSWNSVSPGAPGYPPVFMTSINYPGVYGMHIYGILPGLQGAAVAGEGLYSARGTTATGPLEVQSSPALTADSTAFVEVRVPADAELRLEGIRMSQPGTFRRFVTPPLMPGRGYRYDVTASWIANGQLVTQSQKIGIRAGERVTVDFPTAAPAEQSTTSTLRTMPLP